MRNITLLLLAFSINAFAQLNTRFSVNTGSWKTPNCYQSKLAKDLGAYWAGQDGAAFGWKNCQPTYQGAYFWGVTDSVVGCLQNNGIHLIPTLRCVSPHKPGFSGSCETSYTTSASGASWIPEDTTEWKNFIAAVIERYDGDNIQDFPGLLFPISEWRIETEWTLYWCSDTAQTTMGKAKEFVKFEKMTYNAIKSNQPGAIVSFAGLDTRHDRLCFFDGYTSEPAYCTNAGLTPSGTCNQNNVFTTAATMSSSPAFWDLRRSTYYLVKNALFDELDIHSYGRWKHIPAVMNWIKDSLTTRPVQFLEGGGPFCVLCDTTSNPANLVRDNSSYMVYYALTSLANHARKISWHISPEYQSFNATFGDMDLQDANYNKRQSYYTYRFLAKNVFADQQADTVFRIPDPNPNLWHYRIDPLGLECIWSLSNNDSYVTSCAGNLYRWDIPVISSDTTIDLTTVPVSGNYTISLSSRVPVFFSCNNVLGISEKEDAMEHLAVYPNPAKDQLSIFASGFEDDKMQMGIYDLLGNEVIQIMNQKNPLGTFSKVCDLSSLAPGLYLLKVNRQVKRIIKE